MRRSSDLHDSLLGLTDDWGMIYSAGVDIIIHTGD